MKKEFFLLNDLEGNVVRSFCPEQLEDKKLINLIPRVDATDKTDVDLLARWEGYFIQNGTPYIVMRNGSQFLTLYKEHMTLE